MGGAPKSSDSSANPPPLVSARFARISIIVSSTSSAPKLKRSDNLLNGARRIVSILCTVSSLLFRPVDGGVLVTRLEDPRGSWDNEIRGGGRSSSDDGVDRRLCNSGGERDPESSSRGISFNLVIPSTLPSFASTTLARLIRVRRKRRGVGGGGDIVPRDKPRRTSR